MIHIAFANRIVTAFDIAVIGRKVQRRPATTVGEVRIGASVQQKRSKPVETGFVSRQARGSSHIRNLVYIRSSGQ
jgi:hypothetical protein